MSTTNNRRNLDRFIASTGKTENDYNAWASEVGKKMFINKIDATICKTLNLYTVSHLAHFPTTLPEGIAENEAESYLLEHSNNPYELAKLWLSYKLDAAYFQSKESILAEYLNPFPKSDFELHGDKNHLLDVSRSWFNKDGVNLDVKLKEINEMDLHGEEITLQDAIDFVVKYRPGRYKNTFQLHMEYIEAQFKAITGSNLKPYYAEHLIQMCEVAHLMIQDSEVPF